MKLTTYSNYTMRVLMVAAARSPGLATIGEVARGFDIAETHVVKCVHALGQWGYLETVRGRGGGFRLARAPTDIRVGDVLRLTEDGFSIVECMDPATNRCRIAETCELSKALKRATEAFLAVLDALTLADLCVQGGAMLDSVGLSAGPRLHCEAAQTSA